MAVNPELIRFLDEKARTLRMNVVRMMWYGGGGHIGGSLSCADIITALYFHNLRVDLQRPNWEDRDRFILSKGHAAATLYAALAERGFFPKERLFDSFRNKVDGILQEHPDMWKVPGIDMSTGSLGQGLSVAVGVALGAKLKRKDFNVYVLIGDGEAQEGQIWEAAMAAGHYKLDKIKAVLDYNKLSVEGRIEELMSLEPLSDKWRAFNWHVQEIDGHNMVQIVEALENSAQLKGKPTIIIAHTIKGKGVSFMENNMKWHAGSMTKEEARQALIELGALGDILL